MATKRVHMKLFPINNVRYDLQKAIDQGEKITPLDESLIYDDRLYVSKDQDWEVRKTKLEEYVYIKYDTSENLEDEEYRIIAVSYTHLTLPTIYSV